MRSRARRLRRPGRRSSRRRRSTTARCTVDQDRRSPLLRPSVQPATPQGLVIGATPSQQRRRSTVHADRGSGQKLAMVELAPAGASLIPGSPGRIKPAIPFSDARGKLPLPAQGRRALGFRREDAIRRSSRRESLSRRGFPPKSRRHVTAGLFTLENSAAMGNS